MRTALQITPGSPTCCFPTLNVYNGGQSIITPQVSPWKQVVKSLGGDMEPLTRDVGNRFATLSRNPLFTSSQTSLNTASEVEAPEDTPTPVTAPTQADVPPPSRPIHLPLAPAPATPAHTSTALSPTISPISPLSPASTVPIAHDPWSDLPPSAPPSLFSFVTAPTTQTPAATHSRGPSGSSQGHRSIEVTSPYSSKGPSEASRSVLSHSSYSHIRSPSEAGGSSIYSGKKSSSLFKRALRAVTGVADQEDVTTPAVARKHEPRRVRPTPMPEPAYAVVSFIVPP